MAHKESPRNIRVRSPLLKTLCVHTQDTLQQEADKDAIFAKCISRFPPDFYIGVKQHRLNELFTPPGVENGYSVWMQSGPGKTHFASGAYGLHKSLTKALNGVRDTYICFSGPG